MVQSSTEAQTSFEIPLQGHFYHRAILGINLNMTPYWFMKCSAKEAVCRDMIFSFSDKVPGVTPIETPQGIKSLQIDTAKLHPQAILAGKVSSVGYTINSSYTHIGEIRLPEVPQLVQAREALLKQMNPNEMTLPLAGHLFGNKCYVAAGYGVRQRTFIPWSREALKSGEFVPDFEMAEYMISAFHKSETRLRLSEDRSRVVILLDKLSSEELTTRRIDNIRYTMHGSSDYSEDDERTIDGRHGHIEFEVEDLPSAFQNKA